MDYDCTTFECLIIAFRSVCLLMQVAMPCVLFAASPSELRLKGGTNAEMAPQIDYTVMVGKNFFGFVHLSCIYTQCNYCTSVALTASFFCNYGIGHRHIT